MIVNVDSIVSTEHLPLISDMFAKNGIPGKVEIRNSELEIVTPVYADPEALEILRPTIENILDRITLKIKGEKAKSASSSISS